MFVMTAKLSKPKLISAAVILIAVIAAIVMAFSGKKTPVDSLPKGNTDSERAAYLATFGWSINAIPKETQTVTIPDARDNKVFARYNDLQKDQGFDLLPYAGKEVTRYVYEILNYPEASAPVLAGVLVYEGQIIGGEITDTSPKGVMHGFQKPGTGSSSGTASSRSTPSVQSPDSSEATGHNATTGHNTTTGHNATTDLTAPTEPTTAPTEPATAPTEPATAPTEPTTGR